MSGPSFVLMFLCMPETSAENILLRRAARLRALTGDDRLRAASEIKQGKVAFKDVVWDALIKPIEITILDPAVLFVNVYTSFIYATVCISHNILSCVLLTYYIFLVLLILRSFPNRIFGDLWL